MLTFLKSFLGTAVLSVAMIVGMGQSNETQARPYGGYGAYYGGGYGAYRGGYNSYYAPRYNTRYRYNSYRPYYGGYGYNRSYYRSPYRYNNYYGPRNSIGVGGIRIGW